MHYIFKGGPIDHGTHFPVPFYQSSVESEYNVACTAVMDLAHSRMLIHEFLNKGPDIVTEGAPLIILDVNSDVCMANNSKDTKHTSHIARRVHFCKEW